ncbi:hypothetical protein [Fluviicola taffensis]|uniref:hypothetical protein n=1 Tax=Fluviicola taffensis TaxID=191579 RepID=UPI0031383A19
MSKSMVRILSSLLLVGFLGFLVPINNWHAYAHKHKTSHSGSRTDGLTFKQGVEKCAFCDLQLPLLFHEETSAEFSCNASFDFLFIDHICFELPVKETHLSLRGPPLNVDLF